MNRIIAAAMNLNENTVKTYCSCNGLTDKDITLMFSEKKNKCLYCGAKINQAPKKKPEKFCCDKCRFAWWNKNRELKNKKALYTIKCSGCGKEFVSYASKTRRYCSTHCYAQARCESNEIKREKLIAEKTPCGTQLFDLPADCQCTVCKWFTDGKRGCPCKKEIDKNL